MKDDSIDIKDNDYKKRLVVVIFLLFLSFCGGSYYIIFNKPDNKNAIRKHFKEVKNEYRMSGNSLEDFDLYFLKLENREENKVYSPLAIKYALSMLSEGAKGKTKAQIDGVIGDYEVQKYFSNNHMSFANAMFIRNKYKDSVKKEYIDKLKSEYNAEVIYDDFTKPDSINDWVSEKSFKLIDNIVDDVSTNDYFLVNTLAIDMDWNYQIRCATGHDVRCIVSDYHVYYPHEILDDNSKDSYNLAVHPYNDDESFYNGKFNGKEGIKGGEILADYNKYNIVKDLGEDKIKEIIKPEYEQWLQTEEGRGARPFNEFIDGFIKELKDNYGKGTRFTDFLLYEDDDVLEFAKDLKTYDDITLQYVGIMPRKISLTKYINSINSEDLNNTISKLKEVGLDNCEEGYATRIRGFVPFFDYEYELELMNDLKKLGISEVFSDKANLSKISKNSHIDKAIHKAKIEFSNDGIKTAGETSFGVYGFSKNLGFDHLFKIPVKEIDVTFDKPYMYLIRDKESGEVWFTGTVYEPINNKD